jgi:hypothetical protein
MPPDLGGWALTASVGGKMMVQHVVPKEDQVAHSNADLVRDAIGAFQRGDLDALRHQYFAEDIRYHIPGRSPIAGDYEVWLRCLRCSGGSSSCRGVRFASSCMTSWPTMSTLPRWSRSSASGRAGGCRTIRS